MNILLINDNPVVSRLLVLCTRGQYIDLDEVKCVDDIKDTRYDILFVDDASYRDDMDILLDEESIRKKVFISYDEAPVKGFDETIKKPFLPSQIMNVIESIDMSEEVEESVEAPMAVPSSLSKEEEIIEDEVLPDIFPLPIEDESADDEETEEHTGNEVLDSDEIEKIKALLDMDDALDLQEEDLVLNDEEYEARKVKVIKEQLIADGLEIVEEDDIVEALSTAVPNAKETSDKTPGKRKKKKREFTPEELAMIEKAFHATIATLKPKKIKKLLNGKETKITIKLEDDQ